MSHKIHPLLCHLGSDSHWTTCTVAAKVKTSSSLFLSLSVEGWHSLIKKKEKEKRKEIAKHQCIFLSGSTASDKDVHDYKLLTANWTNSGLHRSPSKHSLCQTWFPTPWGKVFKIRNTPQSSKVHKHHWIKGDDRMVWTSDHCYMNLRVGEGTSHPKDNGFIKHVRNFQW